jgi:trimethylamine:corrinoid methyltransferase-like protein
MNNLQLSPLSPALIAQILDEAFALLEDPGIRIHNQDGLTLLAEAGAQVDFVRQIASIPEQIVRKALYSAPGSFWLYDLNGQPAVHYGGNHVHFDPGSSGVSILVDENGQQRSPTSADFIRFVQLVETLPGLDAQSTAFVCRDVAEGIGDLYRLYLALNFMRKPIITGAFTIPGWRAMYKMLSVAAGGEEQLASKPLAVFDVCPSPPLLWSDLTCQNLIDCARNGVPAELISMPLAGMTCPVTLASAVVQHTAESLSGVTISQLAKAGAPVVWGGAPAASDMRTGATPMGDVNTWLIDYAYTQIGKSLDLPTHTYMGSSDAKELDIQAGLESMGGTLLAALAGINMISGAGMIDYLRCQSFEKLVVDNEMIGMAKRFIRGVEAHEDPLAVDKMRQSAHRADFLARPHTIKWFQKELYIPSEVIDRSSLEAWQKKAPAGSARPETIFSRASQRVEKLLTTYTPNRLDENVRAELHRIAESEARKYGMENLPSVHTEKKGR